MEFIELFSCDTYVYLWSGHPLAKQEVISMEELDAYPCLSFDQGEHHSLYLAEEMKALGIADNNVENRKETVNAVMLERADDNSINASDIIKNKLIDCGGIATVRSVSGNSYVIQANADGNSFTCDEIPITPPYEYRVFDVIVSLLFRNGGKARKGNGRNYRFGYGDCTEDTIVGCIAKDKGIAEGAYAYDPVFVLSAILDWAGIAHNKRGYLELTAEYRTKAEGR